MTAIVLPDIDKSTLEELRRRIPDLSEVELPKMEVVGKRADATLDRLLGRSRAPMWPWVAVGIAIVSIIGGVAAYLTWFKRSPWSTATDEPWTAPGSQTTGLGESGTADSWPSSGESLGTTSGTAIGTAGYGSGSGLTAAESSLSSGVEPGEGA
jgi:hypothetical protein